MANEISLVLSDSLLSSLSSLANEQGTSLEVLCLSLLEKGNEEEQLVEPLLYQSLNHAGIRKEIERVIKSRLTFQEIRRRVNVLENQISRRFVL